MDPFLFTVDAESDGCVGCRFFAGYRVRPDGIHFVMHADGRPSGMAFVEFDCPQEAMRALVILCYYCGFAHASSLDVS